MGMQVNLIAVKVDLVLRFQRKLLLFGISGGFFGSLIGCFIDLGIYNEVKTFPPHGRLWSCHVWPAQLAKMVSGMVPKTTFPLET